MLYRFSLLLSPTLYLHGPCRTTSGAILLLSRLWAVGGERWGCAWSRSARHPNILNFIGICTPEKTQDSSRRTSLLLLLLAAACPPPVAPGRCDAAAIWGAWVVCRCTELSLVAPPPSLGRVAFGVHGKRTHRPPSGYTNGIYPVLYLNSGGGPHYAIVVNERTNERTNGWMNFIPRRDVRGCVRACVRACVRVQATCTSTSAKTRMSSPGPREC